MVRFHRNRVYHGEWTVEKAGMEIKSGLEMLKKIDSRIVVFQGSARAKTGSRYYGHAKRLAFELGKRGYAVMSGGGPGIMHAANSGATEAGARSIGCKAELLKKERVKDKIYTDVLHFHFFFARRFVMMIKTDAIFFYPGGFGTLNELLENAMLMQNGIVDKVPLVCVGKDYWNGLFKWLRSRTLKNRYIDDMDFSLIHLADEIPEIIKIVDSI